MNTITCTHCGTEIEVDKVLESQIEARVLSAERHKHAEELVAIKSEQEAAVAKERAAASAMAEKQLAGERELLQKQAAADLELERKKIAQDTANEARKTAAEQESLIQMLKNDAENAKQDSKKLREDLGKLMDQLRESNKAKDNAELEAKKKLAEEESRIREEVQKTADEKQRLNLAAKEKTITDLQKALDDAQRKAAQGSQQLQGEILELDLEEALANHFRDDEINPVAKGVNGADISHTVKSQSGIACGIILWEIKRTKNWTDDWIPKLKTDLRSAKANIPVIISEILPKQLDTDMGQVDGVWIVKPKLAIILATLLRKGLLDVGRQKALAANQGDKADALYSFVTSHEFSQQIESMIETYQEMTTQVTKERVVYEKLWAQREKQANKLLMGTANIIGSMQGHIGQASMPKIKGLELDVGIDDIV
ncbi:hypothetical protein A2707_00635 [Candidatus Saccharibacteria bacterium RIFCSPHIGHO2_01_FULL_45_15]|nr:MAG: hypothetical protein A2707_00635 [Candidatus Saccharibacteria bacterium RIFCSPHIGHO2_01_FULL_45_15]OGL26882.1 MAG: hypothetical protein A3C39_01750 [Candidatus Saccharibacteria bacterium RIFCSPHIGHO2_02_FULL_46_12]OGL32190.1 MAG: hypothetical protein A3E76_04295 [Candidatus Saccharibacteria bacterium RIFCSPHIGHO2_12_FULL_44_22]